MLKWKKEYESPGRWLNKKDAKKRHMAKLGIYSDKIYYKWCKRNKVRPPKFQFVHCIPEDMQ